jgi:pyrroline-5-carboxylate reductase
MVNQTFGFIGGGRITYILLDALHRKNALPGNIYVSDPDSTRHDLLQKMDLGKLQCSLNNADAAGADIIFLAVHPPVLSTVLEEISGRITESAAVVSLIPAWTMKTISKMLNGHDQIVRMIPNAPSLLGKGFNPACFSKAVSEARKQELLSLFNYWGECPERDENQLEAFAVLTGMGPTYFWPQFQKLYDLGSSFGLEKEKLHEGLQRMIAGAAELWFNSDLSREQVLDLIPVYPLKENEEQILQIYETKLNGLHNKLVSARK